MARHNRLAFSHIKVQITVSIALRMKSCPQRGGQCYLISSLCLGEYNLHTPHTELTLAKVSNDPQRFSGSHLMIQKVALLCGAKMRLVAAAPA
jgi:hypothetical protein